jgi:hypothetical protein
MGDLKNIGSPPVEGILVQPGVAAEKIPFKSVDACISAGSVLTSSTEQLKYTEQVGDQKPVEHFAKVPDSQTAEVQCIEPDTGHVSVVRDGKVKVSSNPKMMQKMHP